MKKRAILSVNIAVLLFGLAGLFAKLVQLPAISITFGRVLFSSIGLGGYMLARKHSFRIGSRKDLLLLIGGGAILALHWWSFLEAIQLSTVAIGTITFSSFPLFVTFLEPLVFRQKLTRRNIVIALVILLGVIITIPEFSLENSMFLGILVGMLSSLAYAVLTVMNKSFAGRYSGTLTAFYEQATAAVVLLPFALSAGTKPSLSDAAQLAGVYSSMETVYGILFALLLLREVPSVREIIGAAIIVGVVIVAQRSAQQ